jgi:hypothetical protein
MPDGANHAAIMSGRICTRSRRHVDGRARRRYNRSVVDFRHLISSVALTMARIIDSARITMPALSVMRLESRDDT